MPPIADFFDLRQSPAWAKYMDSLGWEAEVIDRSWAYIRKFPLGLGSIIKILRPSWPVSFGEIDRLAKKHKAWFVKLEPRIIAGSSQRDFQRHGFHPSPWPLAPSKTIQVDLRKSKKELWSHLRKETRNVIRKAEKNRLLVVQKGKIEQFSDLWVKSMRRKGNLLISGREIKKNWIALGKNVSLLLSYRPGDESQPLAGVLMPVHDRIGYYFAAASTEEANRLGAPSLLVWRAILLAKKLGSQVFDFDGVYDPRYHQATQSWQGFTRFKKGFGGEEVDFVGSFIKSYGWWKRLGFLVSRL